MPKYIIELTKKAKKKLDKLPDSTAFQIIETISQLENNPRPIGSKKLKGRDGYRVRSGNYRIIYEIIDHKLIIEIIDLGHRRDIYS
jgi:mRNA interferase RelE/StbE